MIFIQTRALFVDAYRELNAKKLFWITMILSLLVVLLFATVGINSEGVTFLWITLGFIPVTTAVVPQDIFYLQLFSTLGIGIWLTWIATILALISTSGIIPDLVSGGSIESVLSKPISRTRLFLTKYFTGLTFVALQVGVFTVASFGVIGIRGQVWELRIFLAIPIVLAFFSFLYVVSVFVGLITKAAMPAILLTCLFWAFLFLLNTADGILLTFKVQTSMMQEARVERISDVESNTTKLIIAEMNREDPGSGDNYSPTTEEIDARNPFLVTMRADAQRSEKAQKSLNLWYRGILAVKTVFPKTTETAALLDRVLIDTSKYNFEKSDTPKNSGNPAALFIDENEMQKRVQEEYESRSLFWILGTSFLFEAVLLLFCTWRFSRRDF